MTAVEEQAVQGPPQNLAAEQSLLGAMLLSRDAITEVVEGLRIQDFYRPAHRTVYEAILELFNSGAPVDPVTVLDKLTKSGELMKVGGAPYLHTLFANVPTVGSAGYYAQIVTRLAVLRRLVEAGVRIQQLGYGAAEESTEAEEIAQVVDLAHAALDQVSHSITSTGPVEVDTLLTGVMEDLEAYADPSLTPPGMPILLAELGRIIARLDPGSMTVLAGRPATGKSTLATNLAVLAAKAGVRGIIFSLEMGRSEIMQRILSDLARVNFTDMRAGTMADEDWSRLARRVGELMDEPLPLAIDDTTNQTPSGILAQVRRYKQKHPDTRFVIIDYAQLVTGEGRSNESREREVASISRTCKLIAKQLEVAVILVAQVNRGPEQRQDKKPMPSDLRESGALEADADNIIFTHRPSMYDPDDRPGEADLILAKHRNGPTGIAALAWQGHYCRFVDMAGGL